MLSPNFSELAKIAFGPNPREILASVDSTNIIECPSTAYIEIVRVVGHKEDADEVTTKDAIRAIYLLSY